MQTKADGKCEGKSSKEITLRFEKEKEEGIFSFLLLYITTCVSGNNSLVSSKFTCFVAIK